MAIWQKFAFEISKIVKISKIAKISKVFCIFEFSVVENLLVWSFLDLKFVYLNFDFLSNFGFF